MDEKRKSSFPINLPSAFLLLAVAGNLLWLQAPLTSSRPPETARTEGAGLVDQAVDARLWQDPFDAVNLFFKAGKATNSFAGSNTLLAGQITRHCNDSTNVVLLPVMVTGSQYTEGSEWRIRTRFAVLAGLQRSGFVSEDSDHIGFTRMTWLSSVALAAKPAQTNGNLELTVPFEWLERYNSSQPDSPKDHVLLLWLREEMFSDAPLTRLAMLIQHLRASNDSTNQNLPVRIIGPYGSTTLRQMVREATTNRIVCSSRSETNTVAVQTLLTNIAIYSSSATAADWRIIGTKADFRTELPRSAVATNLQSKAANLKFFNVTCTDDQLADQLVAELARRKVEFTSTNGIALISEWDTFYGRALPQSFTNAVGRWWLSQGLSNATTDCVWRYTYLRGLDGKLAGREDSSGAKPDATGGQTGNKSLTIEQLERPEGNSQLDYIPRLAAMLKAREQESVRTNGHEGRLQAIGLLGSDVYDKLLLLQSLRRRFPDVIFFTTDLDARLSHSGQLRWSRNLIVASSFGLALNRDFQGGIPPFRDTYQTAAFLAAQVAVGSFTNDLTTALAPRIFEIGRYGPYDLSVATNALRLHPPRVNEAYGGAPWHDSRLRHKLGKWLGFAVVALLLLLALSWKLCRTITALCNSWILLFGTLLGAALLGVFCVTMISNHFSSEGEPFTILAGISIWPTELIRLFATLLGCLFIYQGARALEKAPGELMRDSGLVQTEHLAVKVKEDKARSLFRRVCIRCWRDDKKVSPAASSPTSAGDQAQTKVGVILGEYEILGQSKYRALRCTVLGLGYFIFAVCLFFALGFPFVPGRGSISFRLDFIAVMLNVVILIAVTFFVMDATRLCTRLIQILSEKRIDWLKDQAKPDNAWGLSGDELNEWMTIQFIGKRTKAVGQMIYYPFAVLFLLIISRYGFFDAWSWPASLIIVQGLNVSFALFSALHLRREAEHARRRALHRLNERLSRELAPAPDGKGKSRVEQIRLVIRLIENNEEGAFAPLSNQPVIGALAMPFGGASIMAAIEFFALH